MAKVEETADNFDICMDGNCSSYPDIEGEGLYCARGESEGDIERKGCNCPECPVWLNNGLSGMYFCINGSAG